MEQLLQFLSDPQGPVTALDHPLPPLDCLLRSHPRGGDHWELQRPLDSLRFVGLVSQLSTNRRINPCFAFSSQRDVDGDQLFPALPHHLRPPHLHPQLHPLLHLHEGPVSYTDCPPTTYCLTVHPRVWLFGPFYCRLNNFVSYMSVSASVFTLLAISNDRRKVNTFIQYKIDQHLKAPLYLPTPNKIMATKMMTRLFYKTLVINYNFCCEGDCSAALSQTEQGSDHPDNRLDLAPQLWHCYPSLSLLQGGSHQEVDKTMQVGPAVINN